MGSLASPGSVAALAFSIDGHTLATGSFVAGKRGPSATDLAPLVHLTMGRLGRIYGVADGDDPVTFSPNGRILATAGAGLSISLWNVANPARPVRLGSLSGLTHLAASATFSPSGSTLAIGDSAGTLTLWDVADLSHPVRLSTSRLGALPPGPTLPAHLSRSMMSPKLEPLMPEEERQVLEGWARGGRPRRPLR